MTVGHVCEGSIVKPIDMTDFRGPFYVESAARSRFSRVRVLGKERIDCGGSCIGLWISRNDYIPVVSVVSLSPQENSVGIRLTITGWMERAVCADLIVVDENTYITPGN